jgi:hypothetical protein
MSGPGDRFAIVPIAPGPTPPEAFVIGNMDQVMEFIPQSVAREEAEQRLADQEKHAAEITRQQDEARTCALQILGDGLTRLNQRIDQYEARKQERADQQRRDEVAAEAQRIEAMLDALPDPDAPDTETAIRDATGTPSGELHTVAPVDKEPLDPDDPHTVTRVEALTGDMPKELAKGAPVEPGDYTPTSPPEGPYRTPASIGLT